MTRRVIQALLYGISDTAHLLVDALKPERARKTKEPSWYSKVEK